MIFSGGPLHIWHESKDKAEYKMVLSPSYWPNALAGRIKRATNIKSSLASHPMKVTDSGCPPDANLTHKHEIRTRVVTAQATDSRTKEMRWQETDL